MSDKNRSQFKNESTNTTSVYARAKAKRFQHRTFRHWTPKVISDFRRMAEEERKDLAPAFQTDIAENMPANPGPAFTNIGAIMRNLTNAQ